MDLISGALVWLVDPAHWQGADGIPIRLWEHLWISAASVLTAAAVALPVGAFIGHTERGASLAINLANVGRAIPSYAILVIVLPISLRLAPVLGYDPSLGLSEIPTFTAMTALAIPPILVGTYAGLREVDRDLVEAARGMGMNEPQILVRVEGPLALTIILGGIRTAGVQVVATATLGAVVAYGGFGRYLIDGIARHENDRLFAGVILVAGLALLVEGAFAVLQRIIVSPGGQAPPPGRLRPFRELAEVPRPASPL
jgi:osmoprotectant transport system permease protein